MKAQSCVFMEKANELLARAEAMLTVGLYEDAGRTAYLAGFHAAQALIFETHERVFKSHSAVHAEFSRLMKVAGRLDAELRAFLGRTYNLKAIADYETGAHWKVSQEQAAEAVAAAHRFVNHLETILDHDGGSRGG